MSKNIFLTLGIFSLIFLTSCVDRDQADAKLKIGCAAAIELFLEEGYSIKEIKDANYSKPANNLDGDRKVTLTVLESDGWYETDKTYSCTFAEDFGMFNATHKANIYQVNMNDQVYGKKDGKIVGGFDAWLKITNTVDKAMN